MNSLRMGLTLEFGPHARMRNHMTDQPRAVRRAALRAGWNDGAWRRPRRERRALDAAAAVWYERGYAGGLIYSNISGRKYPSRRNPSIFCSLTGATKTTATGSF